MLMVVMTAYALTVHQAPAAVAAFCASAFIVGTLFSRFAAAPMMERFGRMPLLVAGCIAEVALSALYLLNEPVGALIGVRLAHGFSYGVCSATIATVITSVVPPGAQGRGHRVLHAVDHARQRHRALRGHFPGEQLRLSGGIRRGERAGGAGYSGGAASASGVFHEGEGERGGGRGRGGSGRRCRGRCGDGCSRPKRRREDAAANRDEVLAESLHAAASTRVPSTHLEEKVAAKVEHSPLARFVEAGVLPISVVCGLLFFGYSSLLTFLTPYATEIGLARAASVFFVVYALAMFVTRPFTGRAFDRVGPHPVMVPAFVSFALGMVVLAFAANDWMILGAAALLGFGVGTVQSCGLAMAVRVTSDARLSVANATFYMLLDVGVGIGPILLGIVAPLIGYANLYLCMAVVGALALALFLVVAKTEKGAR